MRGYSRKEVGIVEMRIRKRIKANEAGIRPGIGKGKKMQQNQ